MSSAPFVTATAAVDEAEHSLEVRPSHKHQVAQPVELLAHCMNSCISDASAIPCQVLRGAAV